MTEKRFTIPTNCRIKDNKKGTIHNITNDFDTNHLCKLLNELNDENNHIKQTIREAYETERT